MVFLFRSDWIVLTCSLSIFWPTPSVLNSSFSGKQAMRHASAVIDNCSAPDSIHAMSDVTQILQRVEHGDLKAAEELLPLVYEELRRLAAHKMSLQPPGQTLQATALVHEAYLRLVGNEEKRREARRHFFSADVEAMRSILIGRAR